MPKLNLHNRLLSLRRRSQSRQQSAPVSQDVSEEVSSLGESNEGDDTTAQSQIDTNATLTQIPQEVFMVHILPLLTTQQRIPLRATCRFFRALIPVLITQGNQLIDEYQKSVSSKRKLVLLNYVIGNPKYSQVIVGKLQKLTKNPESNKSDLAAVAINMLLLNDVSHFNQNDLKRAIMAGDIPIRVRASLFLSFVVLQYSDNARRYQRMRTNSYVYGGTSKEGQMNMLVPWFFANRLQLSSCANSGSDQKWSEFIKCFGLPDDLKEYFRKNNDIFYWNVSGVNLSSLHMKGSYSGANLTSANLSQVNTNGLKELRYANLTGANISYFFLPEEVKLGGTIAVNLYSSNDRCKKLAYYPRLVRGPNGFTEPSNRYVTNLDLKDNSGKDDSVVFSNHSENGVLSDSVATVTTLPHDKKPQPDTQTKAASAIVCSRAVTEASGCNYKYVVDSDTMPPVAEPIYAKNAQAFLYEFQYERKMSADKLNLLNQILIKPVYAHRVVAELLKKYLIDQDWLQSGIDADYALFALTTLDINQVKAERLHQIIKNLEIPLNTRVSLFRTWLILYWVQAQKTNDSNQLATTYINSYLTNSTDIVKGLGKSRYDIAKIGNQKMRQSYRSYISTIRWLNVPDDVIRQFGSGECVPYWNLSKLAFPRMKESYICLIGDCSGANLVGVDFASVDTTRVTNFSYCNIFATKGLSIENEVKQEHMIGKAQASVATFLSK